MRIPLPAITLASLLTTSSASAMPLDGFLSIPLEKAKSSSASFEAGYDLTTDTVDYSPNGSDGKYLPPVNKKRFEGAHAGGRLRLTSNLSFDGFIWKRTIVSLRDNYSLTSIQGAFQYTLPTTWRNTNFAVRVGAWSNSSDVLNKNSYTRYNGYLFTSAAVHNPKDRQLQLNLIATRPLTQGLTGSLFTGIGRSDVGFGWLEGEIRNSKGCRYHFSYEDGLGELEQLARCGSVTRMKMYLPTDESIRNNIGIEPQKEIEYQSIYWQLGGNIGWKYRHWQARLGYYFQQFNRGELDKSIEVKGTAGSTGNHTVQTDLEYRISDRIGLFLRSEYMSNRLINMVPFAYNGYTASKFGKSGLLLFSGLTLSL